MLTVVCVKWGQKYGPEWVYRLRAMVSKHLGPHDFVCMTDDPVPGVDCVPCAPGLPGWWAKVGLFEPGKFPGRKLYLDLDVVITRSISGLPRPIPGKVMAPDDFSYSLVNTKNLDPYARRLLGGDGTVNSSLMIWEGDAGKEVWTKFKPEKMDEVHGDQNWITQALWPKKLSLLEPGWVCSYKYHVMRGVKPSPIVVFHGEPKVTQLPKTDPLRLAWAS